MAVVRRVACGYTMKAPIEHKLHNETSFLDKKMQIIRLHHKHRPQNVRTLFAWEDSRCLFKRGCLRLLTGCPLSNAVVAFHVVCEDLPDEYHRTDAKRLRCFCNTVEHKIVGIAVISLYQLLNRLAHRHRAIVVITFLVGTCRAALCTRQDSWLSIPHASICRYRHM